MWVQHFKLLGVTIIFTLISGVSWGEEEVSTREIYFDVGGSDIPVGLDLDLPDSLNRVEIVGGSSPDGSVEFNDRVAHQRGESARRYLSSYCGVADSLISMRSVGVDWELFRSYIERGGMPYREEVLSMLDQTPAEERKERLMEIQCGLPYDYMLTTLFPLLRRAELNIYSPVVVQEPPLPAMDSLEEVVVTPIYIEPEVDVVEETITHRPLFAIKTNLLFDLLTMINIEVEIPIKRRWSIATEAIFPWWTMDNGRMGSRRNRLQLFNGNIEGRYWWGERAERPILTGWFAGLYSGGGLYDFERHAKGYQGEFFIAAGLSGGYAHAIGRGERLRMEYSLGVGYLSTNYDRYHAHYCCNEVWHAVRQRSGRYSWFGPSRAKVSLSWLINRGGKEDVRR